MVEAARDAVLAHIGATSAEYSVIFTAGATAATRLLGESWGGAGLRLHEDCHTSTLGLTQLAADRWQGIVNRWINVTFCSPPEEPQ